MQAEVVWNGRDSLTESLDRDYEAMRGEGWDLIWIPPSPMTTPWEMFANWADPDPDQFVWTRLERHIRRNRTKAGAIDKDWTREYTGLIHQGSR